MKVLVIQPKIGMGDMVIYLPYIHAISKKYNAPVSLLVKDNSRARDLFIDDDQINEIITLERRNTNTGAHDGISGFFNLARKLREKFDKVFIFSSSLRYFLISKLAESKKYLNIHYLEKKIILWTSAKIFTEQELGSIISTQPSLQLNKEKIEKSRYKFAKEFKHICLGISASGPTKRWSIKNYIKLCEKINEIVPSKFYIAAGKNDKELISEIFNSNIQDKCTSFKDLKIRETLPIIKNCDLYIVNDTGWLHISSALNIKCLALFMDSPVQAYGKYSENIEIIVPEGETEETTTHDTLGADNISFDRVYDKCIKLLSN